MTTDANSLMSVYRGWDDYQISIVRAIAPLSREQLAWRPAPHLRSVGEIANHIVGGRIRWFHYILGEGGTEFASQVAALPPDEVIEENAAKLVKGLEITWQVIEDALDRWTVADLSFTYTLPYKGQNYAITRQWIIAHVLAHDFHHGGELSVMLGMQGISLPELGDEGGHLAERAPLAEPS
jgi:uncharacterized damage-inducible protein DinB